MEKNGALLPANELPAKKPREKAADRLVRMCDFDAPYIEKYGRVAGLDEVGRGPLAGPVVVACLLLPSGSAVVGVNDSKKLSEKKREQLSQELLKESLAVSYGIVDAHEIDEHNIAVATNRASWLAAEELIGQLQFVLTDAMPGLSLPVPHRSIVHGDEQSYRIAAASIVGKVYRDEKMREFDQQYPEYGFAQHKGYGTPQHIAAIQKYGPCPIHRLSFLRRIL